MKWTALTSAFSMFLSGALAHELPLRAGLTNPCKGREFEGYNAPYYNITFNDHGFTGASIDKGSRFGHAVASASNYFISAATHGDNESGVVYVFNNLGKGWSQSQEINAVYPSETSLHMGESLDMCTKYKTIVIGDSRAHNRSGAVHLYELDQETGQFVLSQTITNPASKAGDRFGCSVSINKQYLVVGAFGHDNGAMNTGAAYIYSRNGSGHQFSLLQNLTESITSQDSFGTAVAIHGETVVVGAPGAENGNGLARIYQLEQNKSEFELSHTQTGSTLQNLGEVVEVNDKTVLLSGAGDHGAGEVLVYALQEEYPGWTQVDTLTAPDGDEHDLFGSSIDINGDDIVIGAKYSGAEGACAGSVYYYHKLFNEWHFAARLAHPMDYNKRTNTLDYFGTSVSIEPSEHKIIVGATGNDDLGSHAGLVDMFDIQDMQNFLE
mmetsp:Transcript_1212/g.1946  ORF Transcript_1212/g.1946 Transcript_1212/m.1946 type:complete len:438 (-) Transcript_1212:124-1437(-)|eukprot:CAMPEP_0203747786 /NCGR_PEP_ID=MMETSP0098-20131031/2841_1 /ASSEMBLY_ACC=CAM_ASM_000208 /TAXON_ID=96639 /ORGANISM=" , Strain NY0313808BC1" /LENGTH=437 /DNA_ID=CAMNT_0050636331 /DNA_START=952 /DNA_END=2265 /DNA_ORIENTATION=+